MLVKILGGTPVNYFSKKANKQVVGTSLFISYLDKNVIGEKVDNLYFGENSDTYKNFGFSDEKNISSVVGKSVNVFYNRYGSVDDLSLVK